MPTVIPPLEQIAVLVPVRGLEGAKARLGEALDAEERRSLVERLLRRTVEAAQATPGVVAVAVVSPDPEALALAAEIGATPLLQAGYGLNEGLLGTSPWQASVGADAVVVVPGDLPAVSAAALGAIVEAARAAATGGEPPRPIVVLVPDRAGGGTNALLVAPPGAIPFRFGSASRAAHADVAWIAGAAYLELGGPLDLDLDTPDDLLAAEALGLDAGRMGAP